MLAYPFIDVLLGLCFGAALAIILWKLVDLSVKSSRTMRLLERIDPLVARGMIAEALAAARESDTIGGRILATGLARRGGGSERVARAIDNAGLIETAQLERGMTALATIASVAPLLGFLGTVLALLAAFRADAAAHPAAITGATVAGTLMPAAAGLAIAIVVAVMHGYFAARIERVVVDVERTAQKTIAALHELESAGPPGRA